jgi:hypothetical protein
VKADAWSQHPDGIELIPRPEPSAADMGGDYLMTWRNEQMHARIYEARVAGRVGQVVISDVEITTAQYPDDVYLERTNRLVASLAAATGVASLDTGSG